MMKLNNIQTVGQPLSQTMIKKTKIQKSLNFSKLRRKTENTGKLESDQEDFT